MTQTVIQILLLIISGVAVGTLVMPQYEKIGDIQTETAEYETAAERAYQANQRLNALVQRVQGLSAQERYRLDRFIPEVADPLKTSYELERLALKAGMFINGLSVLDPELVEDPVLTAVALSAPETVDEGVPAPVNQVVAYDIDLTVAGTYEQFKQLLSDVEMSAEYLEVRSLTLMQRGAISFSFRSRSGSTG
jgi:hypothetical protein